MTSSPERRGMQKSKHNYEAAACLRTVAVYSIIWDPETDKHTKKSGARVRYEDKVMHTLLLL